MAKKGPKRLPPTKQESSTEGNEAKSNPMRIALTVMEFCQAIGLGKTTVTALIKDGTLHSFRVRGRRLIPATECTDFLNRMSCK